MKPLIKNMNKLVKDESGKKYGRLTVKEYVGKSKWLCVCDCGNIKIVRGACLRRRSVQSCGCLHAETAKHVGANRLINISGCRYGRLVVSSEFKRVFSSSQSKRKRTYWLCKCDCGKEVWILQSSLEKGKTLSCGCLHYESICKGLGPTDASFNRVYYQYKKTAKDKNREFKLSEEEFKNLTQQKCYYCGSLPSQSLSNVSRENFVYNGIDRKDNDKGYILDNCVACCGLCNRNKGKMNIDLFLEWIKKVYENTIQIPD